MSICPNLSSDIFDENLEIAGVIMNNLSYFDLKTTQTFKDIAN